MQSDQSSSVKAGVFVIISVMIVIVGIVGAVGLATFIVVPPKGLGDWAKIALISRA